MAADPNSEEKRVLDNPENLIISDSLKDILMGDGTSASGLDSGTMNVRVIWRDGFVTGDIVSVSRTKSTATVNLMMRRNGSLIIFRKSIGAQVEVEMKDGMYEQILDGKISSVSLIKDKDLPEDNVIIAFSISLE
mgnify:CR=1 FL=1